MTDQDKIRKTARAMIAEHGLINLSREALCKRAGISAGSFIHVMGCTFTEFIKEFDNDSKIHTVSKNRVNPELRREHILNVAVDVACNNGYHNLTRDLIAETAGVSTGLVSRYFDTMQQLKGDVMRVAIERKIASIVAQGLAINDEHAKNAPHKLKVKAAKLIATL